MISSRLILRLVSYIKLEGLEHRKEKYKVFLFTDALIDPYYHNVANFYDINLDSFIKKYSGLK